MGHISDSIATVMYLQFLEKLWSYTHDSSFKAMMEKVANSYWGYQTNHTTRISHSRINTTSLLPLLSSDQGYGTAYWGAYAIYDSAPLAQEAIINNNATHLQYLKTRAMAFNNLRRPITGLMPCCFLSDGATDFGAPQPITDWFNGGTMIESFVELYNLTGDPWYLSTAQDMQDSIDRYMWNETLGHHYGIVWSNNGSVYTSPYLQDYPGQTGAEYGYMDPEALSVYALLYRYTQDSTKRNEYLRKAKKEMDLVYANQWTNGVPCKFSIAPNGTKIPKDMESNCRYPDVDLAAYGYMYYWTGDPTARDYYINTTNGLTAYYQKYGLTGAVDTTTKLARAAAFYEYSRAESMKNVWNIRPPIYSLVG